MSEVLPESGQEWSDEQVLEALRESADVDAQHSAQTEQAFQTGTEGTPAGEPTTTPVDTQASAEAATQQENVETFDGGKFNPDELPQELQPAWKQLQAAFTLKTQELASRNKQITELGDLETVQQAVSLYQRIADPNNWQALHSELSDAMQTYGLTPAEAQQAATQAMQEQVDTVDSDIDPEYAALQKELRETSQRLNTLQQSFEQNQLNVQAEYERQAMLGEMHRQLNVVQTAHPSWGDDDMASVVALSSFYNGNLLDAANHYQRDVERAASRYLGQKAGIQEQTSKFVPPVTAGTQSHVPVEPRTVEEAEAGALEMLQAFMSEG